MFKTAASPRLPSFVARKNIMSTLAPAQTPCGQILLTVSELNDSKERNLVSIVPSLPIVTAETWTEVLP